MAGQAKKVLLIGYGEMGHAMEYLLANRHRLIIWHRHLPAAQAVELEAAAADSDFIIYCVPAAPITSLAGRIAAGLSAESISFCFAKGLDDAGRLPVEGLAAAYGSNRPYGVLYGPMISEEIQAGRPGFAQVGAGDKELFTQISGLFAGSKLFLNYSNDLVGLSWSAMLKNVYAILFGAADELQLGDNVRGYLAVAAIDEMAAIVATKGGSAASCRQLAGLGDLITTATSSGSHHHELGRRLARGERGAISGEGVHTLMMIEQKALLVISNYPLLALAHEIVNTSVDIAGQFDNYLKQAFQR